MLNRRGRFRLFPGIGVSWRELLFWTFLLASFRSFESSQTSRQLAGVVEVIIFLSVAVPSAGKLRRLGLDFAGWNAIGARPAIVSTLVGVAAGGTIVAIAAVSQQPLGTEKGWNWVILAVVLGPVVEELVFRGYLMAGALLLVKFLCAAAQNAASVVGVALVFAIAHVARTGTTVVQLCCFVLTGSLYGFLRVRYQSTAAAALAHGAYNLALYVSHWIGISS